MWSLKSNNFQIFISNKIFQFLGKMLSNWSKLKLCERRKLRKKTAVKIFKKTVWIVNGKNSNSTWICSIIILLLRSENKVSWTCWFYQILLNFFCVVSWKTPLKLTVVSFISKKKHKISGKRWKKIFISFFCLNVLIILWNFELKREKILWTDLTLIIRYFQWNLNDLQCVK